MKEEILVKLKMKKNYKVFLTIIAMLIFASLVIGIVYLSFDKIFIKDSDIDVNGNISINYISGKKFKINGNDKIEFIVSNSSDKPSYYEIDFVKVKGNGTYKIFKNNDVLSEGIIKDTSEEKIIDISIDGENNDNYVIEINSEEEIKGSLNIRVQDIKKETFADLIIKNNSVNNDALTKVGVDASVEDEGLIKSTDDLGVSYYFRGKVSNNYVILDNLTWRIIRINGDGTVRLILDRLTTTVGNYYSQDNKVFNYTDSEMHKFLESWYQDNIKSQDLIANTKYCSDINYDDEYTYNAYTRIMVNNIPTFNCLGTVISDHIGLPTIDEVLYAGASSLKINNDYYLKLNNNDNMWYTMSGAKGNADYLNMFMINANGSLNTDTNGNLYRGVRPVINLIKNVEMKGKGTVDEPYEVNNNE